MAFPHPDPTPLELPRNLREHVTDDSVLTVHMVRVPDVLSVSSLGIGQVWIVLRKLQLLKVVVRVQRRFSIRVERARVLVERCGEVVEAKEEVQGEKAK